MSLRSGNPTRFTRTVNPTRRHDRSRVQQTGVGETFKARRDYELKKAQADAPKKSLLGKVKDFFFGPKLPNVQDFASNASYVGGTASTADSLKMLENGVVAGKALDDELLEILNNVG